MMKNIEAAITPDTNKPTESFAFPIPNKKVLHFLAQL